MATTKTTYIDENGVKQPGYTKSGGIYADYIKNLDNGGSSIYTVMLQKNAEDIQGQTDKLNRQYDGLNTQLYRDYMLRKKTLPQQLSAQGISGGLSETTNLGLEAAYQDGLNQNERARYDALADLGAKGSSAELSILKDYRAEAAERAKMMASIGDFSGYKALGYTDEQIAAMQAYYDAANTPVYYSGLTKPVPETEPVAETGYSTQRPTTGSIKASEWDYVLNNINTLLRNGNAAALDNYMTQVEGGMSDSQFAQAVTLIEKYRA